MAQGTNENTNWRELFSLYRDLVGPFKEFENRSYNKWIIEKAANEARGTIAYGYKGIIGEMFGNTVKGAIPFLIVFYIAVNVIQIDGEKLFHHFEDLVETVPVTNMIFSLYDIPFFQDSDFGTLIFAILVLLFSFVLFPCLIFLFPLMIAITMIYRTHVISKAKKTLKSCEDTLPQAEALIQEVRKVIAPHIGKIPRNYRSSAALAFFSDSFFNYKVRNLQEAVNLYDQYLHQQRVEQSQRKMAQAQEGISRQLDYMQDQMDSMEAEINSLYYY